MMQHLLNTFKLLNQFSIWAKGHKVDDQDMMMGEVFNALDC